VSEVILISYFCTQYLPSYPTSLPSFRLGSWHHLALTYDPTSSNFTVYFNGTAIQSKPFSYANGQCSNNAPVGIGGRAGSMSNPGQYSSSGAVNGAVDDLAFWRRGLSAQEISLLFSIGLPIGYIIAPVTRIQTFDLVKVDSDVTLREFEAVAASWQLASSSPSPPSTLVSMEVSTDRGSNWCTFSNSSALTDFLHGGNQSICLFPASSITLRATWTGVADATISNVKLSLFSSSPLSYPSLPSIPIGVDLDGVSYYQAAWPFSDLIKSSLGSSWPEVIRSGTDANGYPLEIVPALDNPPGSSFWVTGQSVMSVEGGGMPSGQYLFLGEGNGTIYFSPNVQPSTVLLPLSRMSEVMYCVKSDGSLRACLALTINVSSLSINMHISESSLGNHVRDLMLLAPGSKLNDASYFYPPYLNLVKKTSQNNFQQFRFMAWGGGFTEISKWSDRATPSSISYSASARRVSSIASISCFSPKPSDFINNPEAAMRITTLTPHGLASGQHISIARTNGSYLTSLGRNLSMDQISNAMVFVESSTTLILSPVDWRWSSGESIVSGTCSQSLSPSGLVTWSQSMGVSHEAMIQMANEAGVDAWVSVPLLADDDYVTRMALLFKRSLNGRLYIELANEVRTPITLSVTPKQNSLRALNILIILFPCIRCGTLPSLPTRTVRPWLGP
jgi:hypothetical protein